MDLMHGSRNLSVLKELMQFLRNQICAQGVEVLFKEPMQCTRN